MNLILKIFIFFGLLSVSNQLCFSQETEMHLILTKAQSTLYSNPKETINLSKSLIQTNKNKAEALILSAKANLIMGNYKDALYNMWELNNELGINEDYYARTQALLLLSEITEYMGLLILSDDYFIRAEEYSKQDERGAALMNNYKDKNRPYSSTENLYPSAQITKGTLFTQLGSQYIKKNNLDSAQFYFEKAIENIKSRKNFDYWEIIALTEYSDYFFLKNENEKALLLLKSALEKSKNFNNPFIEKNIYERLMKNAILDEDAYNSINYYEKINILNGEINDKLNEAKEFIRSIYSRDINDKNPQSNGNSPIVIISTIILTILILGMLVFVWNYYVKLRNKKYIIKYRTKTAKVLSINKETEESLLLGLEKFEKGTKYLNKNMTLSLLATQLNTNTKYLSKVLNDHKQKNFNSYINELRINYIINKLKTDPRYLTYKISYIASESGFSSHNSFSYAFKKQVGMSPNTFIEFLKVNAKKRPLQ